MLSPIEFAVLREAATERPWTGPLLDEHRDGLFHCRACGNELFLSGIFNLIAEQGQIIELIELAQHCSFGTPEELAAINDQNFAAKAALFSILREDREDFV